MSFSGGFVPERVVLLAYARLRILWIVTTFACEGKKDRAISGGLTCGATVAC